MGLSYVELLMEVEDRFDVRIDDRDAEHLTTAGAMSAYIVAALHRKVPSPTPPCLSSHFFYQVRREFLAEWDVGRGWIRPTTRVLDVIPTRHRGSTWRRLQRRLDLPLPGHRLPPRDMSIADLVRHKVSALRPPYVTDGAVNEQAVWNNLCDIIASLTGADRERITPQAHFITDLGMG